MLGGINSVVAYIKNCSVYLQTKLRFEDHLLNIVQKVNQKINFFARRCFKRN